QDFDLVEHNFQWQTGVIHEEELALVIADPIGKLHGAVNDLRHGADGQCSWLGKFFQAGAVSVNRCDIEVRAELLLCLFFSVGDEDLPAQADDGLVRAAVAIGFEAATVHANHLCDVFFIPEDVVVEVAISIKCCLLCNLWRANRAVPDKRWDIIEWERCRGISLQGGCGTYLPKKCSSRAINGAASGNFQSTKGFPRGCPCQTMGTPDRCCRGPSSTPRAHRTDAARRRSLRRSSVGHWW